MSTALATTGVEGLKVIIAESAISSWYDTTVKWSCLQPWWLPGEDLDVPNGIDFTHVICFQVIISVTTHTYQEL